MSANDSRVPQFLLIASFVGFYVTVEYLLISRIPLFNLGVQDYFVIGIISFLNSIPAGVFAFAIVSLLPKSLSSSFNEKRLLRQAPVNPRPRVAVLYATYNDFMPDHARFDSEQARAGTLPFFILDDSSNATKREEVDAFSSENQCPVIRRENRHGYKAGAMNEWIRRFGDEFDYFFILDSDSQASLQSIEYCVEIARRDHQIGVVQTKTLTMTSTPTRLTRSAVTVQHAYMEIVQKAMKKMGTSPYYGHNALIKIDAIRSVGGFIEESNEDYKTLALLHNKGYKSIYAEKAPTWEEVPPDYLSSRKRALRWSRDAVTQLGLIGSRGPRSIQFFLFYGWTTYMSNIALLLMLPVTMAVALPYLFNNSLAEVAGLITLSVIILWPLIAMRAKDPELTPRKMSSALLWGSIYNIPMMAPIGLQILKTTFLKTWSRFSSLLGYKQEFVQEFVVTPKTKILDRSLSSVISKLKAEISLGVSLVIIAIAAGHFWSLVFAAPQIISAMSMPLLAYVESKDRRVELEKTRTSSIMTSPATSAPLPYNPLRPPSELIIPWRLRYRLN